jgi:hypothetical protein
MMMKNATVRPAARVAARASPRDVALLSAAASAALLLVRFRSAVVLFR